MKEFILQLFCLSFKVCFVIAEFAPNVTDMSHSDFVTHNAILFGSPLISYLREHCIYCITFLYFKESWFSYLFGNEGFHEQESTFNPLNVTFFTEPKAKQGQGLHLS